MITDTTALSPTYVEVVMGNGNNAADLVAVMLFITCGFACLCMAVWLFRGARLGHPDGG